MGNKLVTVIVPCFNGEQFVDRCISSIFRQNYRPLELIIVDDGSTDNSKIKIMNWKKTLCTDDIDLKYIYQANQGLGGAINTGIKNTEGEYLSLLDIDDEYLPHCLSDRVQYLDEHIEYDCVITNGYIQTGDKRFLFAEKLRECSREDYLIGLIRGDYYNWAGSYMVRTTAIKYYYAKHNFYCSRYGQNLQILLPVIKNGTVGIIDAPHMVYHKQSGSLSSSNPHGIEKSISNAIGYYDIRLYMITELFEPHKRKRYMKAAEYSYWNMMLDIAIQYNEHECADRAYNSIKAARINNLDTRIKYYYFNNSIIKYYLFRAIRKSRNILLSISNKE